ncbi:MAG TPA: hypothetical protein VJ890_21090, partial [Vineibacter sp.]|nr:hypothetical protein [Vineibacter sp.]
MAGADNNNDGRAPPESESDKATPLIAGTEESLAAGVAAAIAAASADLPHRPPRPRAARKPKQTSK